MRLATVLGCSLSFASLAGCAAGMSPRVAAQQSAQEPTTIAEAKAQIQSAERELAGQQLREDERARSGADANGARAAQPSAPTAPAAPQAAQSAADAKAGGAPPSAQEEPSPCERACRALHSMSVAVTSLCRMTGPTDEQCTRAKGTLEKNRESARIRACGCSG
ncbi:MAG: hypothetical protein U0174_13280 [Polyangiaceae bacterium]